MKNSGKCYGNNLDVDGKSTKVNLIQAATYEACRKTKGHTRSHDAF